MKSNTVGLLGLVA